MTGRYIMGVDGGTSTANPTGYAVLDTEQDRIIAYGLLKPHGGENCQDHIADLAGQFHALVAQHAPTLRLVALEAPWSGPNAATGLVLARLVGAYEAVAALAQLRTVEVAPSAAKVALIGGGKPTKAEIRRAVQLRYGVVVPQHVADATAVALAAVEWSTEG